MGRSAEKTEARAQYGVHAYLDVGEMLDKESLFRSAFCLPNQGILPRRQAIEAGYPLLVEKPLVFNLDEADILLAAAAKRNLFFAINFNHRYAKPLQMAKAAIDSGRIGEISFATWRFGGEGASDHPHANLIETQCHAFDQLTGASLRADSIDHGADE